MALRNRCSASLTRGSGQSCPSPTSNSICLTLAMTGTDLHQSSHFLPHSRPRVRSIASLGRRPAPKVAIAGWHSRFQAFIRFSTLTIISTYAPTSDSCPSSEACR